MPLCPTVAASDASAQYAGWRKGEQPEPAFIARKRLSFKAALHAGVAILSGSDIGVFRHGGNARELEIVVDYGMTSAAAVKATTSVAGRALHMNIGQVRPGMLADLIAVEGDPTRQISAQRDVKFVMESGTVFELPDWIVRNDAISYNERSRRLRCAKPKFSR